jgi:hypothetical protein
VIASKRRTAQECGRLRKEGLYRGPLSQVSLEATIQESNKPGAGRLRELLERVSKLTQENQIPTTPL